MAAQGRHNAPVGVRADRARRRAPTRRGSRPLRPRPRTAGATCSTAASCGRPTGPWPTSSSCWPRCRAARGTRAASPPSSSRSDTEGVIVEHRIEFMGLRGIENSLTRYTDVFVPAENVIGREGLGLKIALATLNTGPAGVAGDLRRCRQVGDEGRPGVRQRSASSGASRSASTTRSRRRSRSSPRPRSDWRRCSTWPAGWRTRSATTSASRPRSPSCTAPSWAGASSTS